MLRRMKPDTQTLTGFIPAGREKFYHDLPFTMPPGVTRLDVRYDYSDAIGSDPHLTGGNTVDIGLFDWRGDAGFRGWSGSARTEFYVTPTDATPGYLPGLMSPGRWHVCLGLYKVAPNGCHYTVELRFEFGETAIRDFPPMLTLDSPNFQPTPHADGWYKGELHCHTVHSDGDSRPADVIAAAEALGLDFLAITDHNNVTHLVEQAALGVQNLILIPGFEVTTYRGHWNVWGADQWIDFRVITPDDMQRRLDFARAHAALTSCNHPRPFGPPFEFEEVRGYQCVEVWNGDWRLFNQASLEFWERRLRRGERLSAVGGSDMHHLHTDQAARIGTPTMWIYCPGDPTASGLLAGVRAGHAFISDAPDGAQLYLSSGEANMGDTVTKTEGDLIDFQARVISGAGLELQLVGAGGVLYSELLAHDDQTVRVALFVAQTPYVRAQVIDRDPDGDPVMRALSNPIYLE